MGDELRSRRTTPAEQLASELSDISDIADDLGVIGDVGLVDVAADAFDYLNTARWGLADYVLRGERTRRMANPPNRVVEAALAEHTDGPLERAAQTLRSRAHELSEQICRTNTVVARWLVSHRVAIANPCYLDTNALLDRFHRDALDPAAVSEDPLYLLVCHLGDVIGAVDEWEDPDAPALQHVRAQLTLPMREVRLEMVAAMAHHAAAVVLARALSRLEAG